MMNKRCAFLSLCLLTSFSALNASRLDLSALGFLMDSVISVVAGSTLAITTCLSVKDIKKMIEEIEDNKNIDIPMSNTDAEQKQKEDFSKDRNNVIKMILMTWAGSYLGAKYIAKSEEPGRDGVSSCGIASLAGAGFLITKHALGMQDRRLREFAAIGGILYSLSGAVV